MPCCSWPSTSCCRHCAPMWPIGLHVRIPSHPLPHPLSLSLPLDIRPLSLSPHSLRLCCPIHLSHHSYRQCFWIPRGLTPLFRTAVLNRSDVSADTLLVEFQTGTILCHLARQVELLHTRWCLSTGTPWRPTRIKCNEKATLGND